MKTEDRLMIPINKIIHSRVNRQCEIHLPCRFKIGLGDKIIIIGYIKDIGITYDVFTYEQEEFININMGNIYYYSIHPFKYTLLSPNDRHED